MTLYEFSSGVLTMVGSIILVYRIIHDLESGRLKKLRLERLCTKWLIFTIFLKIEGYLQAVFDIVPLGKFLLLVFKVFLFLPENSISHLIYKRIHRHLQRVKLESYRSHFTVAVSFICTFAVSLLLKLTAKIAAYIDSGHIEEVERHILQIIKTLQYKKTAINMRHQAHVSDVNKDLNASQFNNSLIDDEFHSSLRRNPKTDIGNQMNRILVNEGERKREERIKVKGRSKNISAEVMIVKPNKATATKAKYSEVELEYQCNSSQLSFAFQHKPTEMYTLTEVRWITKNMMNIEVVLREGGSRIIRIKDISDVVRWIEPVCANLQSMEQRQGG